MAPEQLFQFSDRVLLIEDVRLAPDLGPDDLKRVLVVLLWLQDADAAPVTILAEG